MPSADASAGGGGSAAAELVFDEVTKRYPGRTEPAVRSLSLAVPAGEICVLVGPSGGGKTTAVKMCNRPIDFPQGDISIDGLPVSGMGLSRLLLGVGRALST